MKLQLLKMVRMAMVFSCIAIGVLMTSVSQAQEKFVLSLTEFTIKPGHTQQFEEGVKAWKACYLENKGEWTWSMWKRYNGKGTVYTLTSRMENWAELDEDNDEAGKKCRQIVLDKITPHVESSEKSFASNLPEYDRTGASDMNVVWVTFFRVKNTTVFKETIKEIGDIMVKTEGDKRGYWYSAAGGGPGSPDFFVSTPFKNFAAFDVERDGVWEMVEKAKGKAAGEEMRNKFRGSLENVWSYMYKRMDDLSHNPAQ